MKRLKMGLMALAAISSIGGSFAFAPKFSKGSLKYYAVRTPGGFHWQTAVPVGESCQPTGGALGICSITTNIAPTDNAIPSGHTSDAMLFQPSV